MMKLKHILLAALILPSFALAQEESSQPKALQESVITIQNDLQRAIFLYQNKQFAQALELFNQISHKMSNTQTIDFYVGRSNYEIKNYEMALAAYERVLINEPNNVRVQLEIAQTYLKMGLLKEAKKEFETILNTQKLPQVVQDNIQKQLEFIEGKIKKHFVNVMAIFGLGYDSNINTQNEQKSIYVPVINGNVTLNEGVNSATITEVGSVVNYLYKDSETFYIQNSATIYGMRYNQHMENNIAVVTLSTTPSFIDGNMLYAFNTSFDRVWYGGQSYLNVLSFNPKLSYALDDNVLYDVGVKYSIKDFYQSNKHLDAKVYELSNKISYLDESLGVFQAELIIARESKEDKNQNDTVSKNYQTLKATHNYSLDKKNALSTTLQRMQSIYNSEDALFLDKRKDVKYTLGTTYIHNYSKNITFNVGIEFINNISNIEIYDYNKHTLKSYIYYNF